MKKNDALARRRQGLGGALGTGRETDEAIRAAA